MKKNVRKTLKYKISMWFYRLTFDDVREFFSMVNTGILELLTIILIFAAIFFLPHLFH